MESVVHDQVNLVRLVRRLQSAADTQAWEKAGSFPWTAVANAQQVCGLISPIRTTCLLFVQVSKVCSVPRYKTRG